MDGSRYRQKGRDSTSAGFYPYDFENFYIIETILIIELIIEFDPIGNAHDGEAALRRPQVLVRQVQRRVLLHIEKVQERHPR